MSKRLLLHFVLALTALWITSCKPGIPGGYIQPGKMENILYDYHLAQAMLNTGNENTPEMQQAYKLAVLKKYGVSEKEFDESLAYYMRYTEHLHEIYEHLADRFEGEALAQGITVSDLNQYGTITEQGDTANVWNGERALILSNRVPFHLRSFAIKADTAYHQGDKLMLNFDSHFVVQEGSRDGIAVLAVRFANDSVASQVQRIVSNTHYSVQIEDKKRVGIKDVKGYLMLNTPLSDKSTTIRLLSLTNIRLVRMHTKDETKENTDSIVASSQKADSVGRDSTKRDSTHSAGIRRNRHHFGETRHD